MTDNLNKHFKDKMIEIGLMESIENYIKIRNANTQFIKQFQQLSETFKSQQGKRIEILYKETCSELQQIKKLNIILEKILFLLKVFADKDDIYGKALYKLSKNFKEKLVQYNTSFLQFKNNFFVLKKILENKQTNEQLTR